MENLVNMDGLSNVLNNLIDKVATAVGWVATHDTPNRVAVSTYIQEIQNSNYDPIIKAALISQAKKSIKEYCNQKDVLNIASQALMPTAKPEEIDEDWVAQFMDKARLVSDAEFQVLWGNILAEECNAPGSIPKGLLHIMEQMDKDMATAFMAVAAVSVYIEEEKREYSPMIDGASTEDIRQKTGISYDDLLNLQSVGLIETHFTGFAHRVYVTAEVTPVVIHYFDEEYRLPHGKKTFGIGKVVYTKAGQALCRAVKPQKIEGFFEEYCIPIWVRENK